MSKKRFKSFANRNAILLFALGVGLWTDFPAQAADHKVMSKKQKTQEWERRQSQIRDLERKADLMHKEYEMFCRNEETFKILTQTLLNGSGEAASPKQREEAKKTLALLERVVGPLGAKFNDRGVLLNAGSLEIKFFEKLKQRKICLLETEYNLIQKQQTLRKMK